MKLNQCLRCVVLAALALPFAAHSATGRVVLVKAEALLEQAGQSGVAVMGADFEASGASTGAGGYLQLRMSDGTMVALTPGTKIQFQPETASHLVLLSGGLRLTTPKPDIFWTVKAQGQNIRSSGYLKLQTCSTGCNVAHGLYGKANGGETIVEYAGGRSVLKGKMFRLNARGGRPEVLVKTPAVLDDSVSLAVAENARQVLTQRLIKGIDAFRVGDFVAAQVDLEAVLAANPSEAVVSYYLGLIALEKQDNALALQLLQKYMREDRLAAIEREVPKTITLLSTSQLQEEVANAIAQEKSLVNAQPEPNSIAVQTFASRGDPLYRAMAKGIAAIVIADLTQVPGLKVLEREKIQKLQAEMRLGDSGLAEAATAVRTGRLMRAEKVIVGSFGAQE